MNVVSSDASPTGPVSSTRADINTETRILPDCPVSGPMTRFLDGVRLFDGDAGIVRSLLKLPARLASACSLIVLLASSIASAQRGTRVVAHVIDLRDGALVPGAEVSIIGLDGTARTDSLGRAVLANIPSGAHQLVARRLGYKAATTSIMVSGDSLDVVLTLSPTAQALAGVKVTETAAELHLREFETRLRDHIGGYFVTDSILRRNESAGIIALLHARVPGIRGIRLPSGKIVFASTRGETSLNNRGGPSPPCQVEVFVDGTRVTDGDASVTALFDLAGIEFYPPGYAPVQYRIPAPVGTGNGGSQCGVLLLWTRP